MIIRISSEVQQALDDKRPIVALESTIITHGMPYPRNVEVAMSLERIIREEGAIPATIGVMRGEAVIGLAETKFMNCFVGFGSEGKSSRSPLGCSKKTKWWHHGSRNNDSSRSSGNFCFCDRGHWWRSSWGGHDHGHLSGPA